MLIIEVDRCNGCGACVQACPQAAVSLVEGIARIDSSLCAECQTCVDVCPTGAIHVAMPIVQREVPAVAVRKERSPVTTLPRATLATLTAATVSFIGRYLLPRAAEVLMSALARPPSRGSEITGSTPSASSMPRTRATTGTAGPPGGRRRRHRGRW